MFDSISRSYQLVRHSWSVLRKDKEIMIFPVLSGLASLAVATSFIIPLLIVGHHSSESTAGASPSHQTRFHLDAVWYAFSFLFYLVSYFITIFFNVGVMHCASIRMNGGDPTIADGFKGAFAHLGAIFMWSLVSATIGMILRAMEERAGIIGKIVSSLFGLAWSLLTYFAIPVMIFENAGVTRSIRRSAELFKKTWGETVVGQTGIGMFFSLLFVLGLFPVGLAVFLAVQGTLGIVAAVALGAGVVVYWITLAVISAALTGIFHVALYRYAATGEAPAEFPRELIAGHWRAKS